MLSRANQKGQTLLEVIIVMAIAVIIIGALVFAIVAALRNAQFSKNQTQATKLAQEGIELVRTGRDQNKDITGFSIGTNAITSWRGNDTDCPGNSSSIWCSQIQGSCGNSSISPPTSCYFNISIGGVLNYLSAQTTVPTSAETISQFKRAIIITDDSSSYSLQKTVTSVVTWRDFSGIHESRLTTILRKK